MSVAIASIGSELIAPARRVFQPAFSSSISARSGVIRWHLSVCSSKGRACLPCRQVANQPKITEASTTQSADLVLLTLPADQGRDIQSEVW